MKWLLATFATLLFFQAHAETIERTINYSVGNVGENPLGGKFLGDGPPIYFDETFLFGVGDTMIVNILFDKMVELSDFGEPTNEFFSIKVGPLPGTTPYAGTWTGSIEAIGASGDVWSGAVSRNFNGGGGGFAARINATDTQGIISGIRWTSTITSASQGDPMTVYSFDGAQIFADDIRTFSAARLSCEGFQPPLDHDVIVRKSNRVVPLRMTLLDSELAPAMPIVPPVVQVAYSSTVGHDLDGVIVDSAGKADEGNAFVMTGTDWTFNLSTKGLASGTYRLEAVSGDVTEYIITPTCFANVIIQ